MYACVKLNEKDTVATVTKELAKGDVIKYKFKGDIFSLTTITGVPVYHKIALNNIEKGSPVFKYGQRIGYALRDIKMGEHVHTQNLDSKM